MRAMIMPREVGAMAIMDTAGAAAMGAAPGAAASAARAEAAMVAADTSTMRTARNTKPPTLLHRVWLAIKPCVKFQRFLLDVPFEVISFQSFMLKAEAVEGGGAAGEGRVSSGQMNPVEMAARSSFPGRGQ